MSFVTLNGVVVEYTISFKKNKNTYFYFKKNNFIQINASKYQTESQIVKHMEKNASVFLLKLEKVQSKIVETDPLIYLLWGQKLQRETIQGLNQITYDENTIFEPLLSTDQLFIKYKKFEKDIIQRELIELYKKYQHNPYVDIKNVTIKNRYTTTRFGSCNAKKRTININTHLVHYDLIYLEYVFLHEISHLTHQNHGPKFYQLLEQLSPNYKQLRRELKNSFQR